jgi:cytoskeletal protein RodZ
VSERRLGDILREKRESLNLTVEEVARITKLKKSTIVTLEKGDYKELQEAVYIRGFLKIYASLLGLDYRDLSPLLDRELKLAGKLEEEAEERRIQVPLLFTSIIAFILIVILIVVFVFHWNPKSIIFRTERQSPKIESVQPGKTELQKEFPSVEKTTPESKTPEAIPPKVQKEKEVLVEIRGLDYSWLRVTVDDKKVFEGFLKSGESYSWKGKERITIRTGNAGGISIRVNGRDLGTLGKKGEVLEREFPAE